VPVDTTPKWQLPLPDVQVKLTPALAALAYRLDDLLGLFGSTHWKAPVANAAALPAVGNTTGDVRLTLDTFTIYAWDGSNWIAIAGPGTVDVEYLFTRKVRVPNNGELYLTAGEVNCRQAGVTVMSATSLSGISVRVNAADAARDYDVEVVKDSSAAIPALLGSLTLNNVLHNERDDLAVSLSAGDEWGVRVKKTGGPAGRSAFRNIVVAVRLRN